MNIFLSFDGIKNVKMQPSSSSDTDKLLSAFQAAKSSQTQSRPGWVEQESKTMDKYEVVSSSDTDKLLSALQAAKGSQTQPQIKGRFVKQESNQVGELVR